MIASGPCERRRPRMMVADRRVPAIAGSRPYITKVLTDLGCTVELVADGPVDLSRCEVLLLHGNPGYFPRLRKQLLSMPRTRRPLVATLHAEPLPPPRASGISRVSVPSAAELAKILLGDWRATDIYTNAFKLRRMMREGTIDLLFVMSAEKRQYAEEQGYKSWYIPAGSHAKTGRLLGLERDIDVLFIGDTRPWRRKWLLWRLRRAGIDVTVRGSWHKDEKALWGEERTRFLNRTKIVVHLQRYPGKLAAIRFVLAMSSGALIVSEPPYLPEPYVDGEHFVSATIDEMPRVIRHYLDHPEERERIAAAGHRLVSTEVTYHRSIAKMLAVIGEHLDRREEFRFAVKR